MKSKWKNRTLPRGVTVDPRGYVVVRLFHGGKRLPKKSFGQASPASIDDAIRYVNNTKDSLKSGETSVDKQKEVRWPVPYALKEAIRYMPQWRWYDANLSVFFAKYYFDELWFDVVRHYRPWRRGELRDLDGKKFVNPPPAEKSVVDPTINKELAFLTAAYNKFRELKPLKKIPNVKLPDQAPTWKVEKVDDTHRRRKRVLTPDEFVVIMSEASPRMRRRILAALNSLLRQKDVLALKKSAFDLHARQIEGFMAKVKKSYRFDANDVLMELYDTADGDDIVDDINHEREFQELRRVCREKHGIPDFWFRDIRRTGAMTILGDDRNLAAVLRAKEALGHAKIETTMRYLGISKQDLKVAGMALASAWKYPIQTVPKTVPHASEREGKKARETIQQ